MESGSHIRLVLGRAAKAIERVDQASVAGLGLNLSDFAILEALLHKGPLPINCIGEKVLLTSGSMTAAAKRLMERGFIKRVRDATDGRCFLLHLTAHGRRRIEAAYAVHAQNLERTAEILNPAERSDLVRLLKKIGHHAQGIDLGKRDKERIRLTNRRSSCRQHDRLPPS
jgi:MarR family transcriptional regulator, 2-MHQ and catechol-resistance regulon repressor